MNKKQIKICRKCEHLRRLPTDKRYNCCNLAYGIGNYDPVDAILEFIELENMVQIGCPYIQDQTQVKEK